MLYTEMDRSLCIQIQVYSETFDAHEILNNKCRVPTHQTIFQVHLDSTFSKVGIKNLTIK